MAPFTSARPYEIEVTTGVLAALARSGATLQHLHENDQINSEAIEAHEHFSRGLIRRHGEENHPVGLIEVALGADEFAGTVEMDVITVNEYFRQLELAQSELPSFNNPLSHMIDVLLEWGDQPGVGPFDKPGNPSRKAYRAYAESEYEHYKRMREPDAFQ